MRYRMSVIFGHPVIAATRALRFADHVTKRNGGSGDENAGGQEFKDAGIDIELSQIRLHRPQSTLALP